MFSESLSLGSLFGIRIKLNWSVLVIFALIVGHLAVGVFPQWHPEWSTVLLWGVSLAAALVFFVSLLAHELAHSLTAKAYGMDVNSITLFLFGGVSDIEEEPNTPWREIVIAGVGPLMSLALGFLFLWWFNLIVPLDAANLEDPVAAFSQFGPVASVLAWVGPINILLAAFNMIPALPLDGGRVFRAVLWKATGDFKKATAWSSMLARGFSWALIGIGVAMAFGISVPLLGTGLVGGLWLVIIGWFLSRSATAAYSQLLLEEALEGVRVSRLLREDAQTVPSRMSIEELVDEYVVDTDRERFPVVDDGQFVGMVDFAEVHKIDQDAWPDTHVAEITSTGDELVVVELHEDAGHALKTMLRGGLTEVPVVHEGQYRGMLMRDDVLEWIGRHSEMDVPGVGQGA